MNHISVGGRVCRGQIRSSNIWGPSLSGAEFVRGRDVPESAKVVFFFLVICRALSGASSHILLYVKGCCEAHWCNLKPVQFKTNMKLIEVV